MTYMPSFRRRQLRWRALGEGIIRAGEPKEAINPLRLRAFHGLRLRCLSVCLRGVVWSSAPAGESFHTN